MIESAKVWELINQFMKVIEKETGFPVLIYDLDGRIIKATDKSRIGDIHAGAVRIMAGEVEEYAVTEVEAAENPLVREGYSFPIKVEGQIVAGFGITGKLELARPLAVIAVKMITAWITEQTYLEQLSRSEKKYRNIFDHSLNGIFQSTPEGRLLTANATFAEILGYSAPEEMIRRITDLSRQIYVEPLDRERFLEALNSQGYVKSFVTRFRRLDGGIIFISLNARLLQDTETGDPYIEGYLVDITKRINWENTLAASERRFRDLFNEAPVMYVVAKERAGKLYVAEANHTFFDRLGYSQEEVVGTPLNHYFTEESEQEFFCRGTYKLGLLGESIARECCLKAKDGGRVYSLFRALPELDENGSRWGARSMFLDITDRKQAEEKAKRLQDALVQAQKMEAIGSLAGGIAHDFNNILSAVIGYSQLSMLKMNLPEKTKKYIEQILKAGIRARDLVSQILTFSRQHKLEMMPLQVEPLLKESLKMLRATLPGNIEIVTKTDRSVDNIMADPVQVQQIIMNLCTNAAHAMERKGGILTANLRQVQRSAGEMQERTGSEPENYVCLGICDTGFGIDPVLLDRIFDPYFTTKEKGKGTGLGLSVVHGIVKDYDGFIEVKSKPGKGTEFLVFIPAIRAESKMMPPLSRAISGGKERIMIIDDELDILQVSKEMLNLLGYRVDTFSDANTAISFLRHHPEDCDLLITDFNMPKISGIELCQKIREIHPSIKIVVWSGSEDVFKLLRTEDLQISDVLKKPILADELGRKVREVLDRH